MSTPQTTTSKDDSESAKKARRLALRQLNLAASTSTDAESTNKSLDASLKRHTALIKRVRLSLAYENRDWVLKEVEGLALEKYVDEIVGAVGEGILKCKTDRDLWGAVEIISALHRRFPKTFTAPLLALLLSILSPPPRTASSAGNAATPELKDREDTARITKQRPVLRVCAELAMVGIWTGEDGKSGAEGMGKVLKDLLSHDPSLTSLPLLLTFLKSFARPYLGISPSTNPTAPNPADHAPEPTPAEADTQAKQAAQEEATELVERETREKLKRMIENYFETVCKKLLQAHVRLQEQDRRNHEAYIRSGEIFEDRQQAYEKMTKNYEKLLANCQSLSELLHLPLPALPTASSKSESVLLLGDPTSHLHLAGTDAAGDEFKEGGKWEDEEEKRFYEELIDLRDWVPRAVLGVEEEKDKGKKEDGKEEGKEEEEEAKRLEEEMMKLEEKADAAELEGEEEDSTPTPTGSLTPTRSASPSTASALATPAAAPASSPASLMTALLTRLPDAVSRAKVDQAAIDFAFLNSKAARKRLVKFMGQVPKNRTDLLPYYSRLVATLNKYLPDVGAGVVALLEDEFRYLQKKKKVIKEMEGTRIRNISFLSALTKHGVVPAHLILHILKVFLDDFTGSNVDNVAMLIEGCGRFLLRSVETGKKMAEMLDVMRRKQSLQHFDQRQLLLLENAYYHCNPPERAPRQLKERPPMEMFIRHLIYDVLSKKTLDKVLKLLRKLHWEDPEVSRWLLKVFTKVWKVRYGSINLLAVLACDLQRYHPEFAVAVVDQVMEDIRRGLELNAFQWNQRRVAIVKYLAELYNYRLIGSGLIFDTLWSLVTFGHPEGRPLPGQPSLIDMPDDFFRVRLVCTILDACGMCFDKGAAAQKLDSFLAFFQMYVLCKEPMPMDIEFMISDTIEALRPKLVLFKTHEEAARAVDELFLSERQAVDAGAMNGDDSDGEADGSDDEREGHAEEEDEDRPVEEAQTLERPTSPDTPVLLQGTTEPTGPSVEDEADFAKELAKMVSDSGENRKVDRKTAMAMWDSAVIPGNLRKKKEDGPMRNENGQAMDGRAMDLMKFTFLTRRGNKAQTHELNVPASSDLATHTRSAQMQDKEEQQQLKRIVLDYEQREEEEDMKDLQATMRNRGIRVQYGR